MSPRFMVLLVAALIVFSTTRWLERVRLGKRKRWWHRLVAAIITVCLGARLLRNQDGLTLLAMAYAVLAIVVSDNAALTVVRSITNRGRRHHA